MKNVFFAKKKISQFCQLRRLVFDQSYPVHPVSESRGGTPSVTYVRTRFLQMKSLEHLHTQTVRAGDLKFSENVHLPHVSNVRC